MSKQNEHINNWLGSIVFTIFLIFTLSFTAGENTIGNTNKKFLTEAAICSNDLALTIEPANIDDHTQGLNAKDIPFFTTQSFLSGLVYIENQNTLRFKISMLDYLNQKKFLANQQLLSLLISRNSYPVIS